jgi:hypothetical protein
VTGEERFDAVVRQLPGLLERLQACPAIKRQDLTGVPQRGVYVFYEGGKPIYVGRSRRMRARLREHGQPSSDRNSATFALMIAQEEAAGRGTDCKSVKKADLVQDARFKPLFAAAKERVARMKVQVVEIEDPVEQTLFEVYAALALGTPYNDFKTH